LQQQQQKLINFYAQVWTFIRGVKNACIKNEVFQASGVIWATDTSIPLIINSMPWLGKHETLLPGWLNELWEALKWLTSEYWN
jgi:hypothetical protein